MTTDGPALRRLLGTLSGGRPAGAALDFLCSGLNGHAEGGDARAVVRELDAVLAAGRSEADYLQVIIESGARFTPYGEFRTAEDFLRRLRARVDAMPPHPAGDAGHPVLGWLLARLGALSTGDPLEPAYQEVRALVEIEALEPALLRAELDAPGGPDLPDALRHRLRELTSELAAARPELGADPGQVTAATLAALEQDAFGRAMAGAVRLHGLPAYRDVDRTAFEDRFADLLGDVLPHWVADYVDRALAYAQTVHDDASWTAARWARSAVELLVTRYADTDAAQFVDRFQLALVDELLRSPVARFQPCPGRALPDLPRHWWWQRQRDAVPVGGRAGLPEHARWYPSWGAWQARPAMRGDGGAAASVELAERMTRAAARAFGDAMRPYAVTAAVQVLDTAGSAAWAAPAVPARLDGDRVVLADDALAPAPGGPRLVTSVTVAGTFGAGQRLAWTAELLRRPGRGTAGETTSGGWTTVVVDGDPGHVARADLRRALRAWERELGAPLTDWQSHARPTLVGRYGWDEETFAQDPPRSRPLLTGVSRHLWDGELRLGLVGIARAYADGAPGQVSAAAWQDDWGAALRYAGAAEVDELFRQLLASTRQLNEPGWYLLCSVRSGVQLAASHLPGGLSGLVPETRVRALDAAMCTFGHRFGPVRLDCVPGELHRAHPWWRYPAGSTRVAEPASLDELSAALAVELARPPRRRRTRAPSGELEVLLAQCERVASGELAGIGADDAAAAHQRVTDRWELGAALTEQVVAFLQPIAQARWPLPE